MCQTDYRLGERAADGEGMVCAFVRARILAYSFTVNPRPLPCLLLLALAAPGCAPVELTATQEEQVRRCLELAYKEDAPAECAEQATQPMQKAFLKKHPDFYPRLLAERKAFVEAQIAKDMQRRDDLNLCLDAGEAGKPETPACDQFMKHEIVRGLEDRRRRGCAQSKLDGKADAAQRCEGLTARDIENELELERSRRQK